MTIFCRWIGAIDFYWFLLRPQIRQDTPLSLGILINSGKETNKGRRKNYQYGGKTNGEWSGNNSSLNLLRNAFISSQFVMFAEKLLFSRVQKIHFRPPQAAPNTCHNFHSIMFQVIRGTYISSCLKSLNQETTETQNLCGIVLRRIFFFVVN